MKRQTSFKQPVVEGTVPGAGKSKAKAEVVIPHALTVKQLAELLGVSVVEVIKGLMRSGVMANINQVIDYDSAAGVAARVLSSSILFLSLNGCLKALFLDHFHQRFNRNTVWLVLHE